MNSKPLTPLSAIYGFASDVTYDLELAVLIHYRKAYVHRVAAFKRCGCINRRKFRVHITLLASCGDARYATKILEGWPTDLAVSLLELPSISPIPKINGYYLWLKSSGLNARWYGRVDDDSVTDVAGMLSYADSTFGDSAVHLMTDPVEEVEFDHAPLYHLACSLGLALPSSIFEYESSFSSRAALHAVFSCPDAIRYFQASAAALTDPGDRALAMAMHLAGVPAVRNRRSTKDFRPGDLSIVNGPFAHIHYVNWRDREFFSMLEAYEYGVRIPFRDADFQVPLDQPLTFGRGVGEAYRELILRPDGSIENSNHSNEHTWRLEKGNLLFCKPGGIMMTQFHTILRYQRNFWLVGDFVRESFTHFLKPSSWRRLVNAQYAARAGSPGNATAAAGHPQAPRDQP